MNDLNKLCKSVQYSTAGNTCSCAPSNFVVSLGVVLFYPSCVCVLFCNCWFVFFYCCCAAVSHCNNFLCRQVLRRPLRDCCSVCLQLIEYECGIIEAGNFSPPGLYCNSQRERCQSRWRWFAIVPLRPSLRCRQHVRARK